MKFDSMGVGNILSNGAPGGCALHVGAGPGGVGQHVRVGSGGRAGPERFHILAMRRKEKSMA